VKKIKPKTHPTQCDRLPIHELGNGKETAKKQKQRSGKKRKKLVRLLHA